MSDFWSNPSSTSILHVCEQRRLWQTARMRSSSEPSLVAHVISTIISWAGSFVHFLKCLCGHRLGKSWSLGFSACDVLPHLPVRCLGTGCRIRLYPFLVIAFSSNLDPRLAFRCLSDTYFQAVVLFFSCLMLMGRCGIWLYQFLNI